MLWLLGGFREFGRSFVRVFREPRTRALAVVTVVLLVIGTVFYAVVERWGPLDALYFSVVSLATVGYGDLAPQTVPGKVFTIFYILSGVGVIVLFASTLAGFAIEERSRRIESRQAEAAKPTDAAEDRPG